MVRGLCVATGIVLIMLGIGSFLLPIARPWTALLLTLGAACTVIGMWFWK